LQFVRGSNDTNWYAQFLIDGVWVPPNNPASLSTKNWDEARENARDKYTLVVNERSADTASEAPATAHVQTVR
jgi:hypothetical protein